MWSLIRGGTSGFSFFGPTEWGDLPTQFPPSVGHLDLHTRKTLRSVLGLLTVMVLKKVSESILFQHIKVAACKVKDEKEVTNSLIIFNLLKIIHPF